MSERIVLTASGFSHLVNGGEISGTTPGGYEFKIAMDGDVSFDAMDEILGLVWDRRMSSDRSSSGPAASAAPLIDWTDNDENEAL